MFKTYLQLTLLSFALIWMSCEEKMTEDEIARIGMESCRRPANFISKLGFDASRSAFSSSERQTKGIVLIQLPNQFDTTRKIYQDSSWSQHGYMSSITTDEVGNVFASPIPFVNTLDNSLATIHTVYKINSETGKMEVFMQLPKIDSSAGVNPFGVVGLYYDCHGKKLYVASVGGSTIDKEKGVIYVIDPYTKSIVDKLEGIDPIGVFVGGITGEKMLYYGHARTSDIYGVELNKEGKFKGKPTVQLSLDGLGPRGNDKARRIRFDKMGNLMIYGIDFSFNLAAQSNKPETLYQFGYNRVDNKWVFMKLQ